MLAIGSGSFASGGGAVFDALFDGSREAVPVVVFDGLPKTVLTSVVSFFTVLAAEAVSFFTISAGLAEEFEGGYFERAVFAFGSGIEARFLGVFGIIALSSLSAGGVGKFPVGLFFGNGFLGSLTAVASDSALSGLDFAGGAGFGMTS